GGALRLTRDHRPDVPSEEKRIRRLGGFVSPNGRVVGMLGVSRSLGDASYSPFVSADPFVDVFEIDEEEMEFIVIGCDGGGDVISDELAMRVVREERDVGRAAMKLRDMAYAFGSPDNISVIVISLTNSGS